jgi:hypothetical protein
METIKAKLKEYLAMEHELDFNEFNEYYNTIMAELNEHYQEFKEDALLDMRYVLNTVAVNAQMWGSRKSQNSKKYKKIHEKTKFWAEAITYKLKKEFGYDNDKIDAADEKIDAQLRPKED